MGTLDRSRTGSATGEAVETAKSAAREVTSAARDVAATRAQTLFEANKAAACSKLESVANALRSASSEIEGQQAGLADLGRRTADAVQRASQALQERDLGSIVREGQDLARRQPALFFGGAFAAGLALARFLKASESGDGVGREREPRSSGPQLPGRAYDPSHRGTGYGQEHFGPGGERPYHAARASESGPPHGRPTP